MIRIVQADMRMIIDILMKCIIAWIEAHPDSRISQFMTKDRGPRSDVAHMSRLDRLKSAIAYFFMAFASFLVLVVVAFIGGKYNVINPDNAIFLGILAVIMMWTLICLFAGLYLLLRIFI
jgi:uncharacterized MAPEG superfamily protein